LVIPGWLPNTWIIAGEGMLNWYQLRESIPINARWVLEKCKDDSVVVTPDFLAESSKGVDYDFGFEYRIPQAKFLIQQQCTFGGQSGMNFLFAVPDKDDGYLYHPCVPNVYGRTEDEDEDRDEDEDEVHDEGDPGSLCYGNQEIPPVRVHTVGFEQYALSTINAWLAGTWNSDLRDEIGNWNDAETWMRFDEDTGLQVNLPSEYNWTHSGGVLRELTSTEQKVIYESA